MLALTLVGSASMASAGTLDGIKQCKKILVAMDISAPPYAILEENGQKSGSDYETAQLLAKDLGVELEVVPVTGPNRVPFLLYKKADVAISSFSITESRKTQVDFSLPYAINSLVVAGPSKAKVPGKADLAGKTVGVTASISAMKN
ncbi:MAG: transporter substrate-binding domain-containing protein [Novosphingobium sp.]